jgi:hypothetical protein
LLSSFFSEDLRLGAALDELGDVLDLHAGLARRRQLRSFVYFTFSQAIDAERREGASVMGLVFALMIIGSGA